jgi:hypothetical protein
MQISLIFDRPPQSIVVAFLHNNPQPDKTLDLRVLLQDFY